MILMRFSIKGLGFLSTIVLARLLNPDDFGLVAVVMAIYAFIDLLKQFGFDAVLIQKQDADRADYDTAWTIKFAFGVLATLILLAISPVIADFYDDQRLMPIAACVALMFFFSGATNIGVVDFLKHFQYKNEFKFRVFTKICTVAITLTIAIITRSYWALVIGMLVASLWELYFSFKMSAYRPKFDLSRWKALYSFSGWLMLNNFLMYFYDHFNNLLIAKILNPTKVGIYSVTHEFASLPSTELVASINRATYPGYAKLASDNSELRALYLKVLSSVSIVSIPVSILLALLSPYFIPLFLGDKWVDGIPVMEIMAMAQIFICINSNSGYIYLAIGKPSIGTYLMLTRVLILLSLSYMLIGQYGLVGVAFAYLATSILVFPITCFIMRYVIGLEISYFLSAIYRPVIAGVVTFLVGKQIQTSFLAEAIELQFLNFIFMGVLFSIVYLCLHAALWIVSPNPQQQTEYNLYKTVKEKFG